MDDFQLTCTSTQLRCRSLLCQLIHVNLQRTLTWNQRFYLLHITPMLNHRTRPDGSWKRYGEATSASTAYYANISSGFDLSERPFLTVIDRKDGFTTLVPKFEEDRIAKLDMVFDENTTITWVEEESPYEALARGTRPSVGAMSEGRNY